MWCSQSLALSLFKRSDEVKHVMKPAYMLGNKLTIFPFTPFRPCFPGIPGSPWSINLATIKIALCLVLSWYYKGLNTVIQNTFVYLL